MKNYILPGIVAIIFCILFVKFCTPTKIEIKKDYYIDTSKVSKLEKNYKKLKDSINSIKKSYIPYYIAIANSKKPDTIINQIIGYDSTKTISRDSLIAVKLVLGKECEEINKYKDSIIYNDSLYITEYKKGLEKCSLKVIKQEKSINKWKKVSLAIAGIFGLLYIIK